jgi:glutaconate CoA-transferase subunit A
MAEIVSLREAVADLVHDGETVALEGFTHLIPHAAGHELVRQGRRELTLVRMTPDVVYDQLIGIGCARKLVFSWGGNPGVGSLHRLRDAVENGWPRPLELEEHSHAGMAAGYAAGAAKLPFGIVRGYAGTDLAEHTRVAWVECPFTGEEVAAVPAIRPDVGIIHAQLADRAGNVQLWGVTAVSLAPGGAHPSYAHGYYDRDNAFYVRWDAISRDRDRFTAWMQTYVLETGDVDGYRRALLESAA